MAVSKLRTFRKHYLYKLSEPKYVILMGASIVVPLAALDLAMIFAYTYSYDFSIQAGSDVYDVRALYVEDL
uniref:ABC transporter permease n=1 Tax=Steinernema glaseri TaxID=37863 RepID=A0A1I8AFV6_9BILA